MFTLTVTGTGAAYFYSVAAVLFGDRFPASLHGEMHGVPLYFEAAAFITTIVLLGQILEKRARARTNAAMNSAGLVLVKGDLRVLVKAVHLSRATLRNIKQNLFFAFFYNGLGIPLAAGLLYPFTGWLLSPMLAGVAMSLSSISVVTNALRVRRAAL